MSEDDSDPRSLDELEKRLRQARGRRSAPREAVPPSKLGAAFRLSTELVAAVVVGGGIGWVLDYILGTSPFLLIAMFFLGVATGFLNVVRAAREMNKSPMPLWTGVAPAFGGEESKPPLAADYKQKLAAFRKRVTEQLPDILSGRAKGHYISAIPYMWKDGTKRLTHIIEFDDIQIHVHVDSAGNVSSCQVVPVGLDRRELYKNMEDMLSGAEGAMILHHYVESVRGE